MSANHRVKEEWYDGPRTISALYDTVGIGKMIVRRLEPGSVTLVDAGDKITATYGNEEDFEAARARITSLLVALTPPPPTGS